MDVVTTPHRRRVVEPEPTAQQVDHRLVVLQGRIGDDLGRILSHRPRQSDVDHTPLQACTATRAGDRSAAQEDLIANDPVYGRAEAERLSCVVPEDPERMVVAHPLVAGHSQLVQAPNLVDVIGLAQGVHGFLRGCVDYW